MSLYLHSLHHEVESATKLWVYDCVVYSWKILFLISVMNNVLHCCCGKCESEEVWKNECHFVHQSKWTNSLQLNHIQQPSIIQIKQSYVWIGNYNTVHRYNDQ
jgi:hypothetical protein